jgi:hypothetical protein
MTKNNESMIFCSFKILFAKPINLLSQLSETNSPTPLTFNLSTSLQSTKNLLGLFSVVNYGFDCIRAYATHYCMVQCNIMLGLADGLLDWFVRPSLQ